MYAYDAVAIAWADLFGKSEARSLELLVLVAGTSTRRRWCCLWNRDATVDVARFLRMWVGAREPGPRVVVAALCERTPRHGMQGRLWLVNRPDLESFFSRSNDTLVRHIFNPSISTVEMHTWSSFLAVGSIKENWPSDKLTKYRSFALDEGFSSTFLYVNMILILNFSASIYITLIRLDLEACRA